MNLSQYEPIASLLVQIPLVGIFIYFILEWTKRIEKANTERDNQWREFLKEERILRTEVLRAIAQEVKENTATLAAITAEIAKHEAEALMHKRRWTDE